MKKLIKKGIELKEKLCNSLNGKRYEVVWVETVEYTTTIIANNEKEVKEKFNNGDYPNPRINASEMHESGMEIYEIY